jgi:hypothetical protein
MPRCPVRACLFAALLAAAFVALALPAVAAAARPAAEEQTSAPAWPAPPPVDRDTLVDSGQFPPLPACRLLWRIAMQDARALRERVAFCVAFSPGRAAGARDLLAAAESVERVWRLVVKLIEGIAHGRGWYAWDPNTDTHGPFTPYWCDTLEELESLLGPADCAAGRVPLPLSMR